MGEGLLGGRDFLDKKLVLSLINTSPRPRAPAEALLCPFFCPEVRTTAGSLGFGVGPRAGPSRHFCPFPKAPAHVHTPGGLAPVALVGALAVT